MLIAALGLLFLASPSSGADPPVGANQTAPADTAAAAPPSFAISEIPRHLDESRQLLRELQRNLEAGQADTTIVSGLASVRKSLDELLSSPAAENPERASSRALRDLEAECRRRSARLEGWGEQLEAKAGSLAGRREELKASRAAWERSRAELVEQEFATTLRPDIDAIIQLHDETASQLDRFYSSLLELRTQISGQIERIDAVLARTVEASRAGLWSLLQPDSAPLWSHFKAVREAGRKAADVRGSWEEALAPAGDFLADHVPNLIAHFILFAALLALLLLARSRRQRWEDEDAVNAATPSVVDRPLSAALIGALLLNRMFYPLAPSIFQTLVGIVSVPPMLRLLPRLLPERYVRITWGVAVLFLLDTLEFLFIADPALYRLHMMLVAVLGLGGAIAFLRARHGDQGPRERSLRRWFGGIALIVFAVSILGNLYGAAELARLSADSVLSILYIAIVVIAVSRVLESAIEIALRVAPLRHVRSVRVHRALLERRLTTVVRIVVTILGMRAVTSFFGVEEVFVGAFATLMNLGGQVGTISLTFGDFFAFFLTLWISIQVSRIVQFVLGEDILPRLSLARGVAQTVTRLTHYALVTLGFVLALAATGLDLSKLAILAGGLGVGVGFGLQNIVNNFISGLVLMFERPVQIGDTIEVGTLIGRVQHIGIRASTVRTYSGAEVVVPNANLVSNEVINWTLSDRKRRIELPVGAAYGTDPEQVREILLAAAGEHGDVLDTPAPLAFFLGFGESSLDFEARFWTREFEEWQRVRGEVAAAVQRKLGEAGIEIPFPQRTVHMRTGPPAARPAVAAEPAGPPRAEDEA